MSPYHHSGTAPIESLKRELLELELVMVSRVGSKSLRPVVHSSQVLHFRSFRFVPYILHFEPSLDALSLRSDVLSSFYFSLSGGDNQQPPGFEVCEVDYFSDHVP